MATSGPVVIQGYMKKRGSDRSILNQNKYLQRYFILDISTAMLTVTHAPNKKGKQVLFRDMKYVRIDHIEKDPYGDKDFPYGFLLLTQQRSFFLGCATRSERDMWVNGFEVLFEYRKWTHERYSAIQAQMQGKIQVTHPSVTQESNTQRESVEEGKEDLNDREDQSQIQTEEGKEVSPEKDQLKQKQSEFIEQEKKRLNDEKQKLIEAQEQIEKQRLELEKEKLNFLAQQIQDQQKELQETYKRNRVNLQRGRSIQQSTRNQLEVEDMDNNDGNEGQEQKQEENGEIQSNKKPPRIFSGVKRRGLSSNPGVKMSEELKQKLKLNANVQKVTKDNLDLNNSINDIQQTNQNNNETILSGNNNENNNQSNINQKKTFKRKVIIKKPKSIIGNKTMYNEMNKDQNTIEYSDPSPLIKQDKSSYNPDDIQINRQMSNQVAASQQPSNLGGSGLFTQFRRRSMKTKKKEDEIIIDNQDDDDCIVQEDNEGPPKPKENEKPQQEGNLKVHQQLSKENEGKGNGIRSVNQNIYEMMSPEKNIGPIKNIHSCNNNVSTIDTIIERERDSSFLDRLDKKNKQSLKANSIRGRLSNNKTACDINPNAPYNERNSSNQNMHLKSASKQNSFVENPWNCDQPSPTNKRNQEVATRHKSSSNVLGYMGKLDQQHNTINACEHKKDLKEDFDYNWDDDEERAPAALPATNGHHINPQQCQKPVADEEFEEVWD